ncbi:MAG: hypothetical protein JSW50_05030, partial [Candidatus Latescibacterota bacterium]
RSRLLLSMAFLPLLLTGVRHSQQIATNEHIKAKIQFISDKQSRNFDPAEAQAFDRFIDTDRKLGSHKIVTRVTFANVKRDPCTFVFKWFDPNGKLINESTHRRPDPDPRVLYRGHWSSNEIVDKLEFNDRPTGKYTFVVEYPAGTVLAEKSFNIYLPDDDRGTLITRNSRVVWVLLLGVVLIGLFVASAKVLS